MSLYNFRTQYLRLIRNMLKHLLLQVVRFLVIMGIPTVMMKTIMKPASLMEEIDVDLM